MSTKQSSILVDKYGIRCRIRAAQQPEFPNLDSLGNEINNDPPVALAVRLPSLEARIAQYEHAGRARQAYFDSVYDPDTGAFIGGLADDDFGDDFDDLPEDGLSPHELSSHPLHITAKKSRAERAKPVPAGDTPDSPKAKDGGSPAASPEAS